MQIIDTFQITGSLVVAIGQATDLPVGKKLVAEIIKQDGTSLTAYAYKEWFERRDPTPLDKECFLLMGLSQRDVPIGSEIRLEVALKPI